MRASSAVGACGVPSPFERRGCKHLRAHVYNISESPFHDVFPFPLFTSLPPLDNPMRTLLSSLQRLARPCPQDGRTALHLAALGGHGEMTEYIVAAGGNAVAQDKVALHGEKRLVPLHIN